MHHALEIEEILSNIFGYCYGSVDLASLARTCRTFKESVLDIQYLLWEVLDDQHDVFLEYLVDHPQQIQANPR